MLQAERHKHIISKVDSCGFASIEDLTGEMNISRSTLRRDLLELEQMHKLIRTRGGAISGKNGTSHEPTVGYRRSQQLDEKKRIAQAALEFIRERDTILLDSGTTTIELAKMLGRYKSLMVATYDLYVANELSEMENISLVVCGGMLRHGPNTLVGYFAEKVIEEIHADRYFLSADAIDLEHGCMCYNMEEISVKKSMIKASKEVVLLGDHTKFETIAFINVCSLRSIHTIITGKEIRPDILERLREMDIDVVLV